MSFHSCISCICVNSIPQKVYEHHPQPLLLSVHMSGLQAVQEVISDQKISLKKAKDVLAVTQQCSSLATLHPVIRCGKSEKGNSRESRTTGNRFNKSSQDIIM